MRHRRSSKAVLAGAVLGALLCGQAAATPFSYDFTNKGTGTGSSMTFSSTSGSSTLSVKVSAWHATDPNSGSMTTDSISGATLGIWSGAGMGDLYGNDSTSNGTHQIDNVGGGVDFLMLQFSQDVTLSAITRNVYSMSGVSCCDSDAALWADTAHVYGSPSSSATVALSGHTLAESTFTSLAGNSSSGISSPTGPSASASVWFLAAAFNQSNDGFKLAALTANVTPPPPPAVPEPATWTMMIAGFGGIGGTLRRQRARLAAA